MHVRPHACEASHMKLLHVCDPQLLSIANACKSPSMECLYVCT